MATLHRILICSVGYGQGHHAASAALAEEFLARGMHCRVCDPCELASPKIFAVTQAFYRFCVHRMPWLWRVTYAQTDTANWRKAVHMPILRAVKQRLALLLQEERPDIVVCTYPLYAYMLDALREEGLFHGRYAMVVTDAREISRPWMLSDAPAVYVTDAVTAELVRHFFGLPDALVRVSGFPVRRRFRPNGDIVKPSASHLHILFGAYRSTGDIVDSVRALLGAYPQARITLLAGNRAESCRSLLSEDINAGRAEVLDATDHMAEYLAESHLYIGKAGAATMFECYASHVPMLVNFALPGQEQGNLELLLQDGAGVYAESPAELLQAVHLLLADDASVWSRMRAAMAEAHYDGAAARIVNDMERSFGV